MPNVTIWDMYKNIAATMIIPAHIAGKRVMEVIHALRQDKQQSAFHAANAKRNAQALPTITTKTAQHTNYCWKD